MVSLSGLVCLFLFHIHIDADSAVLPALSITVRRSFPVTPSIFSDLHVDWPGNPRQPISNGKHQVFQPLSLHLSTNSAYLSIFRSWASSILSSHGTVSSMITHTLLSFEDITMSGRRFVGAIYSGKRNCLFRSTSSIQSLAMASIPAALPRTLVLLASVVAAFTNLMNSGRRCFPFAFFTAVFNPSAMASSTWSCLHRYFPPDSDLGQELNMCSSVARLPQFSHAGSSINFHIAKLLGDGRTSYTEAIANFNLFASVFHNSFHVSFLLRMFSQRIHFPWAFKLTAFVCLVSSSCWRTSCWTISLRWRLLAPLHCARVIHPKPNLPWVTVPTRSLCLSLDSASSNASCAFHLSLVL